VRVAIPDPRTPDAEKTVSVMISGGMLVQWAVVAGKHLAPRFPPRSTRSRGGDAS